MGFSFLFGKVIQLNLHPAGQSLYQALVEILVTFKERCSCSRGELNASLKDPAPVCSALCRASDHVPCPAQGNAQSPSGPGTLVGFSIYSFSLTTVSPHPPHSWTSSPPPPGRSLVLTSIKGEMVETIFMGMISIKYQLTCEPQPVVQCIRGRINVYLISTRPARLAKGWGLGVGTRNHT